MEFAIKFGFIAAAVVVGLIVATKIMLFAGNKNWSLFDNFTAPGE